MVKRMLGGLTSPSGRGSQESEARNLESFLSVSSSLWSLLSGTFDSWLVLSWVFAKRLFQDGGRCLVCGLRSEGLAGGYGPRGFASVPDENEGQAYCCTYQENVKVSVEKNLKAGSVLSGPGLHVGVGQILTAEGAEQRCDYDELAEDYRVQEPV